MSADRNALGGFNNGLGIGASATEQSLAGVTSDDDEGTARGKVNGSRQARGGAPLALASMGSSGLWFACIVIFFFFGWLAFSIVPGTMVRVGFSGKAALVGCGLTVLLGIFLIYRAISLSIRKSRAGQ